MAIFPRQSPPIMPLMAVYPRMVVMAMVMFEMREGILSGNITLTMIWKGAAPMLCAISITLGLTSLRLLSTSLTTKGKAAMVRGTMDAAVPTAVPAMLEIYAYFVRETAVSFEYEVPTQEEFARRLAEHTEQFPRLEWEENGEVLGYAYAGRPYERAAYHWCAEISCYLAAQVRGRGIGRKRYARIEELLR